MQEPYSAGTIARAQAGRAAEGERTHLAFDDGPRVSEARTDFRGRLLRVPPGFGATTIRMDYNHKKCKLYTVASDGRRAPVGLSASGWYCTGSHKQSANTY